MKIRYWPVVLGDVFLTFISIVGAVMLSMGTFHLDGFLISRALPFMTAALIARPFCFAVSGVYGRMWRYAAARDFVVLAGSVIAGSVILLAMVLFVFEPLRAGFVTYSAVVTEGLISLLLLGSFRLLVKENLRYSGDIDWKKTGLTPLRSVLIVGAGSAGVHAFKEITENPYLGLRVAVFLDDDPKKIGMKARGVRVLGPTIRLSEVIKDEGIDEVIIAMPSAAEQTIRNIQAICQDISVPFRTVPFFSDFLHDGEDSANASFSGLKLPMSMPDITSEEIQEVVRVMQSRNLSIGSRTVEFERLIADVAQAKHAIAVMNGTSALHLCMIASNIGPGDEVITTPFSFIASANCILFEKGTPVFVDIDPVTLNMDPAKIEAAITERTKAIVAVHVFGQPADMDPIMAIAARHNLLVIEDACEAIGADYKGRRVGAMGVAGTFAFYPNKQMTTGEGAALVTNNEDWANLFRSLRNQGRDKFDGWLNHSRLGYNYRMSELNASVGVVQLRRLDELLRKRSDVADSYKRVLSFIDEVKPLEIAPTTTRMSWFVYVVRLQTGIERDTVITMLEKVGVPTRPYFSPIHLQPFYRQRFGYEPGRFPEAERAGESIVALPFHNNMKIEEIEIVCKALKEVIEEVKNQGG